MLRYTIRRVLGLVPVIIGISLLVYVFMRETKTHSRILED